MKKNIRNVILATFVADAYALGAHWIYDEMKLQNLPINWDELNDPQVIWHKGKEKGDFTHYGDQSYYLLQYLKNKDAFKQEDYYALWSKHMSVYNGYIDAATRNSLEKIGSQSNDFSICSRIAPLLLVAKDKESFLNDVTSLVEMTHNTELAKESSLFFAELLWDSLSNQNIQENITNLKNKYPRNAHWIDEGITSQNDDTILTLKKFGTACGINDSFSGVIHLLLSKDDFKTVMKRNIQAGGDSAARGMAYAMISATQDNFILPQDWLSKIKLIDEIKKDLEKI